MARAQLRQDIPTAKIAFLLANDLSPYAKQYA